MPTGYTQIEFSQLQTNLATRLNDPNNLFWTAAEIISYLQESLRTWQAFSQFLTARDTFTTDGTTLFYDLYSKFTNDSLTPSVTDQDLIKQIEQHLQEKLSLTSWTGTEQFNYAQVVLAIQRRLDKFKIESGLSLSIFPITVSTTTQTVELDDSIIDIRHAMWLQPNGTYSTLWRSDSFETNATFPKNWNNPGLPTDYLLSVNQPLLLTISPPNANAGAIYLIVTTSGPNLDPAIGPTVLGIPDDFTWIVKFGAMADILGTPGPGQDLTRAAYCESRWKDGMMLARMSNFVRMGYINIQPCFVDAITEIDQANPSWMNTSGGSTAGNSLVSMGNMVGVAPLFNGDLIALDIVPKYPIPVAPTDFVDIGQELMDVILDYAQHLASFKEGFSEMDTRLYENLVRQAYVENDRLRAIVQNFDVMSDRDSLDAKMNQRRISDLDIPSLSYSRS